MGKAARHNMENSKACLPAEDLLPVQSARRWKCNDRCALPALHGVSNVNTFKDVEGVFLLV